MDILIRVLIIPAITSVGLSALAGVEASIGVAAVGLMLSIANATQAIVDAIKENKTA